MSLLYSNVLLAFEIPQTDLIASFMCGTGVQGARKRRPPGHLAQRFITADSHKPVTQSKRATVSSVGRAIQSYGYEQLSLIAKAPRFNS